MQGVCRQVEVLYFSNPSEWLKDFYCKDCIEEEDVRYSVIIVKSTKSARKNISEFAARTKLRRDRDLGGFEGKMRAEVTSQDQVQEKICQFIWPGVIKKLNRRWNFLEE
jgi:hypothetical protein